MIVPSIDILGGKAVQLRGGRHPLLEVGDPESLAEKLSRAGEIAIVDLDAALGKGSNKAPYPQPRLQICLQGRRRHQDEGAGRRIPERGRPRRDDRDEGHAGIPIRGFPLSA